jgi:hypothetical protein
LAELTLNRPGSATVVDGSNARLISPLATRTYVRYLPTMRYEVDMVVQQPLDDKATRFLTEVQKSANRVLRFHGDESSITIVVEAHGMHQDDAIKSARGQIARIYPGAEYQAVGEVRPF